MDSPAIGRRELLVTGAASALVPPSWPTWAQSTDDAIAPFTFRASDAVLADLKRRLDQARWPESETGEGWDQGVPLAALQDLVDYWRTGYDWRRCEAELAGWPQFKTPIDGLGIHFIHVRSRHKNALPIVLTHGWPSTVLLHRDLIGPLTDPTAHGGTAADAFDVIIPSLPGFGFSDKPTERGWNVERTARAWGALMQRLGYKRYVAQGGDWGAFVTTAMAQQQAPGLAAIHLNFAQTIPDVIPSTLLPDQSTRSSHEDVSREHWPISASIHASPDPARADGSGGGQAAWIYDIFDSGTGGSGRLRTHEPRPDAR